MIDEELSIFPLSLVRAYLHTLFGFLVIEGSILFFSIAIPRISRASFTLAMSISLYFGSLISSERIETPLHVFTNHCSLHYRSRDQTNKPFRDQLVIFLVFLHSFLFSLVAISKNYSHHMCTVVQIGLNLDALRSHKGSLNFH